MDFQTKLHQYANLVVRSGCNLQPGQELYITAPICAAEFTRLVAKQAYEAGAKDVTVRWTDECIARLGYEYSPLEVYENFPDWLALLENSMAEKGAAVLSIDASDPDAFAGVDPRKPAASAKASYVACKPFYDGMTQGKVVWCVVSAAAPAWAKKVFPDCPEAEAVDRLWDAIFRAVRADQPDPVAAWEEHKHSFEEKIALLNEKQFVSLHYQNAIGTDITIGLPENHEWAGGGAKTVEGRYFFPNMPTEEIFCSPHKDRVDGTVHSAMPLNYRGTVIDDFSITFQNGRITNFSAAKGGDVLKEIFATDEGARHLGEVALIPKRSPISEMGILFYSTLYDENASCHFAVGRAFPECVQGGLDMTEEQLAAAGLNDSAIHVDFMLGTEDLKITGLQKDGTETLLFENGNWAENFTAGRA